MRLISFNLFVKNELRVLSSLNKWRNLDQSQISFNEGWKSICELALFNLLILQSEQRFLTGDFANVCENQHTTAVIL